MSTLLIDASNGVSKAIGLYVIADSQDIKEIEIPDEKLKKLDHKYRKKSAQLANYATTFEMSPADKKKQEKETFKRKPYISIPRHLKEGLGWVFSEYLSQLLKFKKEDIEMVNNVCLSKAEEECGKDLSFKRIETLGDRAKNIDADMVFIVFRVFAKMPSPEGRLDTLVLDAKQNYPGKKIESTFTGLSKGSPFVDTAKKLFDGFLRRIAKAISRQIWLNRGAISGKLFRILLMTVGSCNEAYNLVLMLEEEAPKITEKIEEEKKMKKELRSLKKDKESQPKEKPEQKPKKTKEEVSDGESSYNPSEDESEDEAHIT